MTLIREIQEQAVDNSTNLASLLRKTMLLAARLNYAPLSEWAQNELNGYKDQDALPDYRRMTARLVGSFNSVRWSVRAQDIPDSAFPKDMADRLKAVRLAEPVANYEDLLRSSESSFQNPLPADLAGMLTNKVLQYAACTAVWREIPRTAIVGVLDAIRNRLLAFAIDIERQFPNADAPQIASSGAAEEKIGASFSMIISGDNNVVNAQGHDVKQSGGGQIMKGDLAMVKEHLRTLEVDDDDIEEILTILKSEAPPRDMTQLPPKTSAWLGKMVGKAASGVWHTSIHAAGALLADVIGKYWGIFPH